MIWTAWIVVGCFLAAVSVFLKGAAIPRAERVFGICDKKTAILRSAVDFQLYTSLGLIALGLVATRVENIFIQFSGICFFVGVILFSGSLYFYLYKERPRLLICSPVGVVFSCLGWVLLGWAVLVSI